MRKDRFQQKQRKSERVIFGEGPPCARCLVPMTAWKHAETWVPPKNKGYYQFWYQCRNDACLTHQVMPSEAYVKSPLQRKIESKLMVARVKDRKKSRNVVA